MAKPQIILNVICIQIYCIGQVVDQEKIRSQCLSNDPEEGIEALEQLINNFYHCQKNKMCGASLLNSLSNYHKIYYTDFYKETFQLVMILKIKASNRSLCIVCSVTIPKDQDYYARMMDAKVSGFLF
jgi:hypothetical protein